MMQCTIITKCTFDDALNDDDDMYFEYNAALQNDIKMHL